MSIRLSDKHGVNPSILVCPICYTDSGVALFGRLKGDEEAPRRTLDSDPCDACKKWIDEGRILIVECVAENNKARTGRLWAVTFESFTRNFEGTACYDAAVKHRVVLITPETAELLGLCDKVSEDSAAAKEAVQPPVNANGDENGTEPRETIED